MSLLTSEIGCSESSFIEEASATLSGVKHSTTCMLSSPLVS